MHTAPECVAAPKNALSCERASGALRCAAAATGAAAALTGVLSDPVALARSCRAIG